MVDDNVSFTDAADTGGGGPPGKATSSGMLDLIGSLNNEKQEKKGKDKSSKKKNKKKKGKKGKTKKVRGADRYESQNFLFRIEGSIFCASIVTGLIMLVVFLILALYFSIHTGNNFVHYMWPFWSSES